MTHGPDFADTHTPMSDAMSVTYRKDTSADVPRWPGLLATNGELIDALSRYPREDPVLINGDGNQILEVVWESTDLGDRVIIQSSYVATVPRRGDGWT
jgi:hypothetical protein